MLEPSLPAIGRNLAVNLPAGQLGCLVSFGFRPDGPKHFGCGCNGLEEILQPHNDDFRVPAAVNDEALLLPPCPAQDLAELGPGGKGRDDSWHRHNGLMINVSELINQFIHIMGKPAKTVNGRIAASAASPLFRVGNSVLPPSGMLLSLRR